MNAIKIYFIDGYNVIHKMPRLASLMKSNVEVARQNLIDQIKVWLPKSSNIILVFDGVSEMDVHHGRQIKIVFSKNRTADFIIRNELEKRDNNKTVCVVSSDHEVQNHARACGAQIMKAEDFIYALKPKEQTNAEDYKSRQMNKNEIDMWLKEFNKTKDE